MNYSEMRNCCSSYRNLFLLFVLFFGVLDCCIAQSKTKREKSKIVIATWNIGYFSNGASINSYVKPNEYGSKLAAYRLLIYNDLHPDILSINEYNRVFCGKDNDTNNCVPSSVLFDRYDNLIIGPREGLSKALFSNIKLKKQKFKYFKSHKSIDGDEDIRKRESYYIAAKVSIDGYSVMLASVHLLFSKKIPNAVQQKQIEELITAFSRYKRVILLGDWNTTDYSLLKNAGYHLANDGSLITFPSRKTPLDNIAVKGVEISDVKVVSTSLSDHYPIACCISLKE